MFDRNIAHAARYNKIRKLKRTINYKLSNIIRSSYCSYVNKGSIDEFAYQNNKLIMRNYIDHYINNRRMSGNIDIGSMLKLSYYNKNKLLENHQQILKGRG